MSSFKVFGIKVDGLTTMPKMANRETLHKIIDDEIKSKVVCKVVVEILWRID